MEIINTRRSIREFKKKEIEKEKIELLLRAAMQAPSAKKGLPWEFLVVQKKETIERLANLSLYSSPLKTAKAVIILLTQKDNLVSPQMYPQDMASATTLILLEARNLGLGSCWMGVYPREERMMQIATTFNLKDNYEPFSMIALGYPKDDDAFKFVDRFDESKIHYEEI